MMVYIYPLYKKLNENSIVFDGGGHRALFSKEIIKEFNANLYIYEPNTKVYDRLKELYGSNEKVKIINKALYSSVGDKTLYICGRGSIGSSLYESNNDNHIDKYKVETTTIETEMKRFNLERIDFLKLNVEGSEYEIINNIKPEYLRKINQIGVCFHSCNDKYTKKDILNTVHYLEDNGFSFIKFFNKNRGRLFARREK